MITIPVYNMMLLPDITFYLKKDVFKRRKLEDLSAHDEILFLMLKEDKSRKDITEDDFYPIGMKAEIENPDHGENVKIRALNKVEVTELEVNDEYISAKGNLIEEEPDITEEEKQQQFEALKRDLLKFVQGFQWGVWARTLILNWNNMNEAACGLGAYMNMSWDEKYQMLATDSQAERCEMIKKAVYELIEAVKITEEAEQDQSDQNEQIYRESAIRKQIAFLQKQLDEMHPENVSDVRKFEMAIDESGMNEEAEREARKVLNRMKQEGKDSHEYGLLYDYLDFVTDLSWKKEEVHEINLKEAEEILDEDHYGLRKVKDRIIEQMAVMALNQKESGSILLFVGAPGTGKTSIGQSIARALHRKYVRISLGGIRDEAEIRGHRRTYVGAMPGRIMEGIRRSGVSDPVIVLDEVDKLAKDYSGDPASALLEVLDPEQNTNFTDHYMNVPYDLSNVLFVCTANSMDTIPEPLLNRMEVISFQGYTPVEKFHIARKHLLPKAMQNTGITAKNLKVTDAAIRKIIDDYTMEAGVRDLKKQLDHLCRCAAVRLVKGEQKSITVGERKLSEYLGKKELHHERILERKVPGVVTGLAWTSAGGEILFIETSLSNGSGEAVFTGQLGDVMKESAQIAVSVVKNLFPEETDVFEKSDLHIHVPSGAVPKDGPSAGITLVTALASLVTGKAVSPEIAMTGEISLRGKVLPIGGLPEKLMAAERAGIRKVLIPYENKEDLDDVAEEVKEKLQIIPVKRIQDVLKNVFEK